MIESFADKNAELIWNGRVAKKLPRSIQDDAREVLRMLNNIKSIEDLYVMPSLRPHKLVGDRKGTWSVRVTGPWRVTFLWDEAKKVLTNVRIEDYH